MIKVLHFYKTYYPDSFGGIEQVIYQLAEGGVEKGISTDVLSVTPADKDSCETISQHTAHKVRQDFSIASNPFSFRVIKKLGKPQSSIRETFRMPNACSASLALMRSLP